MSSRRPPLDITGTEEGVVIILIEVLRGSFSLRRGRSRDVEAEIAQVSVKVGHGVCIGVVRSGHLRLVLKHSWSDIEMEGSDEGVLICFLSPVFT